MSSTTGMLTLSVHEALTFEGTEVALHPDLFAASATSAAAVAAPPSTSVSVASESVAGRSADEIVTNDVAAATSTSRPSGAAAAAVSTRSKPSTASAQIGLQVGDLIEVRVWTPKPGHHRRPGSIAHNAFRTVNSPTLPAARNAASGRGVAAAAAGGLINASAATSVAPSPSLSKPSSTGSDESPFDMLHDATASQQQQITVKPSTLSATSPSVDTSIRKSDESNTETATPPSVAGTTVDVGGKDLEAGKRNSGRQIPMRREGSLGANAVELGDIITPMLEESPPQPKGPSGEGEDIGSSTNPSGGIGTAAEATAIPSAASSLSSSPQASLVAPISSHLFPSAAPAQATLPPLPPSRLPSQPSRSRTNTADGITGSSASGANLSKTGGKKQQQSSLPSDDAPDTPITSHGNRSRINTLPADVRAGSTKKELQRQLGSDFASSPKSSGGVRTTDVAPAPVPLVAGKVGAGPGHVRDISKLSVGSDFAVGTSSPGHVRESSSISSVAGEPLGVSSMNSEEYAQAASAGVSGRVARSLMLRGVHEPSSQMPHRSVAEADTVDMLRTLAETHDERTKIVMLVSSKSLTSIKKTARTQISILRAIAELYNLSSYDQVTVTKVASNEKASVLEEISADFVLVTFKDQFISRGEMYHFQNSLVGRWLYEGIRLDSSSDGIRANAMEIRHGNRQASSGIITDDTKITFRSRSTRIIWLVQISSEMWDYTSPYETKTGASARGWKSGDEESSCETYFDTFTRFAERIFREWEKLDVSHSLTVVFFSRTYFQEKKTGKHASTNSAPADGNVMPSSEEGKETKFDDYYTMVIENETRSDWSSLVYKLKKAFVKYPVQAGWNLDPEIGRIPSIAAQGNLLEAINVTLNLLTFHYYDRDLHRTGNSIVVVSAGSGVFEVDRGLASITRQRMMDNGIGSDMLSLTLPPLHVAPFFLFDMTDSDKVDGVGEVPHWMHLSYFHYDDGSHAVHGDDNGTAHQKVNMVSPGFHARGLPGGSCSFPNGFVARGTETTVDTPSASLPRPAVGGVGITAAGRSHSQRQQRHLINSRDFEDILEACRPRNRGQTFSSVPSALALLLPTTARSCDASVVKDDEVETVLATDTKRNSFQSETVDDRWSLDTVSEWGAVDFEGFGDKASPILLARDPVEIDDVDLLAGGNKRDVSGSESESSASSLANSYSYFLGRSHDRGIEQYARFMRFPGERQAGGLKSVQIQPSSDINLSRLTRLVRSGSIRSDDSLSTSASRELVTVEGKGDSGDQFAARAYSASALKDMLSSYDSNVDLAPQRKKADQYRYESAETRRASTARESAAALGNRGALVTPFGMHNDTNMRLGAPTGATAGDTEQHIGGGIGAALHQFDGMPMSTGMTKKLSINRLDRFQPTSPLFGGPASFGRLDDFSANARSKVSTSRFESIGMPIGSDPPDRTRQSPFAFGQSSSHTGPGDRGLSPNDGKSAVKSGDTSTALLKRRRKVNSLLEPSLGENETRYVKAPSSSQQSSHSPMKRSSGQPHHQQHHQQHQHQHQHQNNHHHTRKHGSKHKGKGRSKHHRLHLPVPAAPAPVPPPTQSSRRRAWVLNPFRQEDEDEVLAKRTHNRRRWSHVFPPGEVEFKRHAGPNWKSLCQPAILPTTIDYFPSPQELHDPTRFQFSPYSISLGAMDRTDYRSHSELLREMVRQRLIQDYQIVPRSIIEQSTGRGETDRKSMVKGNAGTLVSARRRITPTTRPYPLPQWTQPFRDDNIHQTHTLSMGHRIQRLSYNPQSDAIEVVQYYSRFATNDPENVQTYHYHLWCPVLQRYTKVTQQFRKYADEYLWNKVDNLVCGDAGMKLFEGSRFRRIMFRIIPDDNITEPAKEAEYVNKFQRFKEYVSKQLLEDIGPEQMEIKVVTNANRTQQDDAPAGTDRFKNFRMPLKKGSTEKYQWMEMVMDSTFDTRRTYKIMLHWLVASAIKVEAQVQLLQRRCAQYGLRLVSFPQDSISSDVQLHPFIAPIVIPVSDNVNANAVEALVHTLGFIDDGEIRMNSSDLEKSGAFSDYKFPIPRSGRRLQLRTKQYVHSTGTIFFRLVKDVNDKAGMIVYENRRYINGDDELIKTARSIFAHLRNLASYGTADVGQHGKNAVQIPV